MKIDNNIDDLFLPSTVLQCNLLTNYFCYYSIVVSIIIFNTTYIVKNDQKFIVVR